MPEQISKLTPDRDLQAYFLTPSAIAALSSASSSGFTLSGKWRQQFDWAVVEWNRDNTFEHPALRYLPDGDLSGLVLTYDERRESCIPVQSNLYPTVAWDQLRIWVPQADGSEIVYFVSMADHATPAGTTQPASATMTLIASPAGSRVGLAFLEEHYYYDVATDDLNAAASGLVGVINSFSASSLFTASSSGASVTVTWNSSKTVPNLNGSNGNRLTVYGFTDSSSQVWSSPFAVFAGGSFPDTYHFEFDFSNLMGYIELPPDNHHSNLTKVPTGNVRKVRWTWSADLQPAEYVQTEFSVTISNWSVTGINLGYQFAGPGSRRIEDSDPSIRYSSGWSIETGNYSGSKVHYTGNPGASLTISYEEGASHTLYLGVRRTPGAPTIAVSVDGMAPATQIVLALAGEDVLVRYLLGTFGAGAHTVTIINNGASTGNVLYFDFLEIVYPSNNLPDFAPQRQLALATDWDTYHSQSLPAERTAWLIHKLGFEGRVNHYTGALWFYEIVRSGTKYASLTVTLQLTTGRDRHAKFALAANVQDLGSADRQTLIDHLVLPDDTSSTVAIALAALINVSANLVWASADGPNLTLTARYMGTIGNGVGFELVPTTSDFTVTAPSNALSGGIDGTPYEPLPSNDPDQAYYATLQNAAQFWRTDLLTTPRINRAARDWHRAFFKAIKGYGMDVVAAFSTELMNGDGSLMAGIAQRYPDGNPVILNTPAIQTNFSPTALAYWQQVYLDMAQLQSEAGLTPYLQSGEVQWWYFPKPGVGMPFYDAYSKRQFAAQYGVPIQTIVSNSADPAQYPNEAAFLPALIGSYTAAIRSALQTQFPGCRYEVLYPTDTNNFPLTEVVNYPSDDWRPANLTCLKTESFGFTGSYDLVNCVKSMNTSAVKGFPNLQRSHLVGISDAWSAWLKEVDIAQSQGLESVVLFALDQYCLIGYPPPPFVKTNNSQRQG